MRAMAKTMSPVVNGLVATASIVVIVFGLKLASGIIGPVLFAATLAILFAPLLRLLERRGLSTWLALLVLIAGLVAIIGLLLLVVYLSLLKLRERLPVYQALLAERLSPLIGALGNFGISPEAVPNGWMNGSALIGAVLAAIGGLLSSAVGIVFFLFTLCLLLIDSSNFGRKFRAGLRSDNPFQTRLVQFTREIQEQYRIQCYSNFLSAVVLTAAFALFRIDFAVLWGFFAFILGFIPNVGLIIASIPAIVLAFILHGPGMALVIFILAIILNVSMDNLVKPRFMVSGRQLPMPVAFLSFIFWSWVFGFLGALLAIPATLFLRALLASGRETHLFATFLSEENPGEAQTDIVVPTGVPATAPDPASRPVQPG